MKTFFDFIWNNWLQVVVTFIPVLLTYFAYKYFLLQRRMRYMREREYRHYIDYENRYKEKEVKVSQLAEALDKKKETF